MIKKLERLLGFLFTLLFIFLAAAWVLLRANHVDQILPTLSHNLESLTQLPVHMTGEIKYKFFPTPTFYIEHAAFGSPEPSAAYFAQFDHLKLKLRIKPLFQKKIVFKSISADQFQIQIRSHAKTTVNKSDNTMSSPIPVTSIEIQKILLDHGRVTLDTFKQPLRFEHLQINTSDVSLTQAFPLQFKTVVQYGKASTPLFDAALYFKGNVTLPMHITNDPATLFQQLVLAGECTANDVHLDRFTINRLHAAVKTQAGRVLISPMTMNVYKGDAFAEIALDLTHGRTSVNLNVTNMDAKQFFGAVNQKNPIDGNLNLSFHSQFNTNGTPITKTLTGTGQVQIQSGDIHNFNLPFLLQLIRARIHHLLEIIKMPTLPSDPPENFAKNPKIFEGVTPFSLLKLQFHLHQNEVDILSFLFQSKELQLQGTGHYEILSNAVHGDLHAILDTGSQELNEVTSMLGGSLPLHLSGYITAPDITADSAKITPYLHRLLVKKVINTPANLVEKQIQLFFNPLRVINQNNAD